jgi:hypothetical protein
MANEQITNLIDAIVTDNAVDSEQVFNSIMADKIADRLQDYRKEVAASFFNPAEEQEEVEVDTQENATE